MANVIQLVLAGILPLLWIVLKLLHVHLGDVATVAMSGMTIMAAAFILSWAAEAAEEDFSGSLVLALLALIAVLPEYAVDGTLSWNAGKDSSYAAYAIANMTGANRLLIGLGWPAVVIIGWMRKQWGTTHKAAIRDQPISAVDCGVLAIVTIYAFTIPLKGYLAWFDAVILFSVFAFYIIRTMSIASHRAEVIGPAKLLVDLRVRWLRIFVWSLLLIYGATAIFLSAEPFVEALISSGKRLGIEEFMLVQWLAPLASEMPEFILAIIFALRISSSRGLSMLVSSKINQWTLLVGSIPVIFLISSYTHGHGLMSFTLDARQTQELYLTAAQSLFAVTLLSNRHLSLVEAMFLACFFIIQTALPMHEVRMFFIWMYIGFAAILTIATIPQSLHAWKSVFHTTLRIRGY